MDKADPVLADAPPPSDPDYLIGARGLCKGFDDSGNRIEILKGIDLDLNIGETIAVVGASGIGKSTLLHLLGTLDRPDSGTLWFRGEDVSRRGSLTRFLLA